MGLLAEAKGLDKVEELQLEMVDQEQNMVDKTPWMRRTGWAKEFAGRDMAAVGKRSQKPTKDEQELHSVWQSVHRVLNQCVAGDAGYNR